MLSYSKACLLNKQVLNRILLSHCYRHISYQAMYMNNDL